MLVCSKRLITRPIIMTRRLTWFHVSMLPQAGGMAVGGSLSLLETSTAPTRPAGGGSSSSSRVTVPSPMGGLLESIGKHLSRLPAYYVRTASRCCRTSEESLRVLLHLSHEGGKSRPYAWGQHRTPPYAVMPQHVQLHDGWVHNLNSLLWLPCYVHSRQRGCQAGPSRRPAMTRAGSRVSRHPHLLSLRQTLSRLRASVVSPMHTTAESYLPSTHTQNTYWSLTGTATLC